jgi:hypothetical protein
MISRTGTLLITRVVRRGSRHIDAAQAERAAPAARLMSASQRLYFFTPQPAFFALSPKTPDMPPPALRLILRRRARDKLFL